MNDAVPNPLPSKHADADVSDEHHCACGALLARWVDAGLELKCRRCKRIVTIPFPETEQRRRANT